MQDIISVDPCHKFTWCLDACIREKNVDVKRSRELQGFLDSIKVIESKSCFIICVKKEILICSFVERTRAGVRGPKYDFVRSLCSEFSR